MEVEGKTLRESSFETEWLDISPKMGAARKTPRTQV
jgi:hypothetical protein